MTTETKLVEAEHIKQIRAFKFYYDRGSAYASDEAKAAMALLDDYDALRAERDALAGLARESRDALDAIANKEGTDRWLLACEIDAALAVQETKL